MPRRSKKQQLRSQQMKKRYGELIRRRTEVLKAKKSDKNNGVSEVGRETVWSCCYGETVTWRYQHSRKPTTTDRPNITTTGYSSAIKRKRLFQEAFINETESSTGSDKKESSGKLLVDEKHLVNIFKHCMCSKIFQPACSSVYGKSLLSQIFLCIVLVVKQRYLKIKWYLWNMVKVNIIHKATSSVRLHAKRWCLQNPWN